jgi:hypothetical protein
VLLIEASEAETLVRTGNIGGVEVGLGVKM